jgi:hypothetical protein
LRRATRRSRHVAADLFRSPATGQVDRTGSRLLAKSLNRV